MAESLRIHEPPGLGDSHTPAAALDSIGGEFTRPLVPSYKLPKSRLTRIGLTATFTAP